MCSREARARRPEPSPRLGWALLALVVFVAVGGCWALVVAAERALEVTP